MGREIIGIEFNWHYSANGPGSLGYSVGMEAPGEGKVVKIVERIKADRLYFDVLFDTNRMRSIFNVNMVVWDDI